jgi:ParB-like chromosome segregation protein Spo0J
MASIKNKACTLKVGQIEKDPILALGTTAKDIEKYGRVAKAYGNVAPAVVSQNGTAYRVLAGQARLEACARNGIHEMPVAIAEASGEAEQMKLSLMLSTVKEEGCPLSEGAFIDALVTKHGVTRQEMMKLLNKSKSWLSKRQSLSLRLTDGVKEMVRDGVVCARTAEEIAKLPGDVQAEFASSVVRDGLNKNQTGQLANLYIQEDAGMVVC